MDRHVDVRAMPGEEFIDRIVENFRDAMMQGALVRAANIHAGFFPNGFKTFQ